MESAGPGEFGLGQKWLESFYTVYVSEWFFFLFPPSLCTDLSANLNPFFFFPLVKNHRTLVLLFLLYAGYKPSSFFYRCRFRS